MRKFTLPIILAVLGFLLSTRWWIKTYDKLPPYGGLVVYYIILTLTLIILETLGLVVGGIKFSGIRHTIGSILIIFSFFIVVDWESCYINIVTKGNCKEVSNVYFASEDGATYDLWNKLFPNKHDLNRILTYVVTPFILSFIGVTLLTGEEKLLTTDQFIL